jgi:hypothetical protein
MLCTQAHASPHLNQEMASVLEPIMLRSSAMLSTNAWIGRHITETNTIQLVLFGMQNRAFGPY